MSKSKSVYKSDLPNFLRKGSFDIKSIQGLNPQIFTIQAQSFINQNFFHSNAELLHDKSNHFISNLRKMSQKKLKSERNSYDIKKVNNKSASSLQGSSLIDTLPKKLNIRLNSSTQDQDPTKHLEGKYKKNSSVADLKQITMFLENLIQLSQAGNCVKKELEEFFVGLISKNGGSVGILQVMKSCFEKSLGVIKKHANELLEMKDGLCDFNRQKEEEQQKYLFEITEFKKTLETQNSQIEMLQAKEKQLIQFLLAIKQKGIIDLEAIFNEEFNNAAKSQEQKKTSNNSLDKTNNRSKTGLLSVSKAMKDLSQEADVSIVNDSEESSFNYFGKETSGQITPQPEQKKIFLEKKKPKALNDVLKLNLKIIPKESQENFEKKEEILPSEMEKRNSEKNVENKPNFKKKGEKNGINEEMKENLLEKLKNFRKVYEKLSKK